ncbi:MAG: fructosamine kinase family protein [Myxococcota bacterium]|jgi:fructosamine-3-kinase|nr:fructosamine kinase family protein [Myxococcota bacterium]
MTIHDEGLAARVESLLGQPVVESSTAHGGDIGVSARVRLADGRGCFAKRYPDAPAAMAQAEAAGLDWLREVRALRIPEVVAVSQDGEALLLLEWIDEGRPAARHDEELGRGLAALHAAGAPAFGFGADGYIATLPQSNRERERWCDFYRAERLAPLADRAAGRDLLPSGLRTDLGRLFDALPDLCGPDEAPARLHGDLWAGNRITDSSGAPCLIDPAVYGGHREIDLAMMRLFGGFGGRVFDAYEDAFPLAPGARDRVGLYQLYPLLVHVNLFGAGYVGQLAEAVRRYL